MGACNIETTRKGKLSRNEIYDLFKSKQDQDRLENGHQDGYSGDFQTVSKVDYRLDQVFTSYNEAHDFCLKNASKWDTVVAVYFCEVTIESKSLSKLQDRVKALSTQLRDLESKPLTRSKAFHTCGACKSRLLALKVYQSAKCPVCQGDLRPQGLQKRIASLKTKIATVKAKLDAKIKIEREKAIKKESQFETMLAGWGAC